MKGICRACKDEVEEIAVIYSGRIELVSSEQCEFGFHPLVRKALHPAPLPIRRGEYDS